MCIFLFLFSFWIAYSDWRYGRIPFFPLIGLVLSASLEPIDHKYFFFYESMYSQIFSLFLVPFLLFFLSLGTGILFWGWKRKKGLGEGDILLFFACGFWLEISQIPLFLICAGGVGVFLSLYFQQSAFPFAPAILFSLFCTFCARWFFL